MARRSSRTSFKRSSASLSHLVYSKLQLRNIQLVNSSSNLNSTCLSRTVSFPSMLSVQWLTSPAAFPASGAFDQINDALSASEADRKDAVKQAQAIFAFTLKNKAGETESWHLDLKNKGVVAKGLGEKPTGMLYWKGVNSYCPIWMAYARLQEVSAVS